MKKSSFIKILSVVMTLAVLIVSLPLYAFAVQSGANEIGIEPDDYVVSNNFDSTSADPFNGAVFEKEENRNINAKTFHLSDGSSYMAVYNGNIHRQDENGFWKDIDNRLYEKDGKIINNDGNVVLTAKLGKDIPTVSYSEKGKTVFITALNTEGEIAGKFTNNKTDFDKDASEIEKLTTLDNISSSVLYKNAFKSADLQYVLSGTDLKENIIINEKGDTYSYSFALRCEGMLAEQKENGEIYICDSESEEFVFLIPVPFMWDAAREYSDKVSANLEEIEKSVYIVTYTADTSWVNEEVRKLPVTIDPPIYSSSSSNIINLYISSSNATHTWSAEHSMHISNNEHTYWKMSSLPALPSHAYIAKAELSMKCSTNSPTDYRGYIAAYDVVSDWTSTLTWNDVVNNNKGTPADNFTDCVETYCTTYDGETIFNPGDCTLSWNITPIVRKWYEGENYGVMFMPATGTTFTGTANVYSNDSSNEYYERPQLCITYIDQKGIEDYWTFSSQSAGFAGTGYVNNATGNLVVTIPTLTTTDALMPITPTIVYNYCMDFGNYVYPNVQTGNTVTYMPKSCKLNLGETVIWKEYTDSNGNKKPYYIWADGDGTEHYFLSSGTSNVYYDEDGLQLKLEIVNGGCEITDSQHNVRFFATKDVNPSGMSGVKYTFFLKMITDENGNRVLFTLDSYKRVTEISLLPNTMPESSKISQLKIIYHSSTKKPIVVYNPNSGEGVVLRYSNSYGGSAGTSYGNYLKYLIHAHGSTSSSDWNNFYNTNSNAGTSVITVDGVAEYEYNYLGLMSRVTNTLSKFRVVFNTYESKRISSIVEYSTISNGNGQKIGYDYNTYGTVVRSSGKDDIYKNTDDLLTTYTFDRFGRTISTYTTDLNRTQIFGASFGQYVGEENPNASNNLKSTVQSSHVSNYLLNGDFELNGTNNNGAVSFDYWTRSGNIGIDDSMSTHSQTRAKISGGGSLSQELCLEKGKYTLAMLVCSDETILNNQIWVKVYSQTRSAYILQERVYVNRDATSQITEENNSFAVCSFSVSPVSPNINERLTVTIQVTGSSSSEYIWLDNVMLSKTDGAAEYDMVSMGHFESYGTICAPEDFWNADISGQTISIVDSGESAFGNVIEIDPVIGECYSVTQTVYRASDALQNWYYATGENLDYRYNEFASSLTLSGWAKGTSQSYGEEYPFRLHLCIRYVSREHSGYSYDDYYLDFNKDIDSWQYASASFLTDPQKGLIDCISVSIDYFDHPGEGYFDGISLVRNSVTSVNYSYDLWGNIIQERSANGIAWYTYNAQHNRELSIFSNGLVSKNYYEDSNNNLISYTDYFRYEDGSIYNPNIIFDSQGHLVCVGVYSVEYYHNDFGQVYSTVIRHFDDEIYKELVSYTDYYCNRINAGEIDSFSEQDKHIFGYVKSETDSLGNTTYYFYDPLNGRLNARIDPENHGECYTYDGMGNITEVCQADGVCSGGSTSDYQIAQSPSRVNFIYDSVTKRLTEITTYAQNEPTTYSFTYDAFSNTSGIRIDNYSLVSYSFNQNNGKMNTLVYGNGLNVHYVYDGLDRISEIQYRNGSSGTYSTVYEYEYDAAGHLSSIYDVVNDEVTMYKYDAAGKLISSFVYDASDFSGKYGEEWFYDSQSRPEDLYYSFDYRYNANTIHVRLNECNFYDNSNGLLDWYSCDGPRYWYTIEPEYDCFGRLLEKNTDIRLSNVGNYLESNSYSYLGVGNSTSMLVSEYIVNLTKEGSGNNGQTIFDTTYRYEYDANGNITCIKDANGNIRNRYQYDSLGQLTREDNYALDKTFVWEYDSAGNITSRSVYDYTTSSTYGSPIEETDYCYYDSAWGDLLSYVYKDNYDEDYYWDASIVSDNIGNPTWIYGYYGEMNLSWSGRQLLSIENFAYEEAGSFGSVVYSYNANGIRTKKTVDGVTHEYLLSDTQIMGERWTKNGVEYLLLFLYDEGGAPIGMRYRTSQYGENVFDTFFFETNLLGDIVAVYNTNGVKLVSYVYDAWGKVTVTYYNGGASTAAQYNPFRYRGYYYDTETNWYYLQSRYYNPEWGRFINADGYVNANGDIIGFNMFAYCSNNPVMGFDPSGKINLYLSPCFVNIIHKVSDYITNDDPNVVQNAKFMAFYRGRIVIKIDFFDDIFLNKDPQGASFGVIFIDSRRTDFETDLNHEYGHTVQLKLMGPLLYTFRIAIPSVKGYNQNLGENDYYSQLWEVTADMLGGVQRNHNPNSEKKGWKYLLEAIKQKLLWC